ncbi:hypothetical protein JNUCC42_09310 [Brevibacterium sp. JNUCC-42]|nr:hypothetical protein JNUCC42_09310 [Brevibacterium sp. JNUCC-42]
MEDVITVKLEHFDLPKEQIQFSAFPKKILNTTDGEYRIVITNNRKTVRFFLLHATDRVKKITQAIQMRCFCLL